MKKLSSIAYSSAAFNIAMLLLRLCFGGILLFKHGLMKLQNFDSIQNQFYNFMGIGTKTSLALAIFAEVFCALFVVIGLFTRITLIPIIITMLVAIFGDGAGKPILESELAIIYLCAFFTLLLCGPGKISVDGMMNK
jgi:putative oxidoreductase